jgi:hypothetical protein
MHATITVVHKQALHGCFEAAQLLLEPIIHHKFDLGRPPHPLAQGANVIKQEFWLVWPYRALILSNNIVDVLCYLVHARGGSCRLVEPHHPPSLGSASVSGFLVPCRGTLVSRWLTSLPST